MERSIEILYAKIAKLALAVVSPDDASYKAVSIAAWLFLQQEIKAATRAKTSFIKRAHLSRAGFGVLWFNAILNESLAEPQPCNNVTLADIAKRDKPDTSPSTLRAVWQALSAEFGRFTVTPKDQMAADIEFLRLVQEYANVACVGVKRTELKGYSKNEYVTTVKNPLRQQNWLHIADYMVVV